LFKTNPSAETCPSVCAAFTTTPDVRWFSVFVSHSVQISGSGTDIQGRLAAGTSVNFASSVGDQIDGPNTNNIPCSTLATPGNLCYQYSVVVGGAATFTGSVFGGPALANSFSLFDSNNTKSLKQILKNKKNRAEDRVGAINYQCGAFTGATNAVPINFPGNFVQLANLQTVMASFTTGSVGVGPNIVFLGSGTVGTEYFQTTAANLQTAKSFVLQNVVANTIVITVNTPSTTLSLTGVDMSAFASRASHIIWNIVPAITNINLMGMGFQGSILATGATLTGSSSQIAGQLIAFAYNANIQINLPLFAGCPTAPALS